MIIYDLSGSKSQHSTQVSIYIPCVMIGCQLHKRMQS